MSAGAHEFTQGTEITALPGDPKQVEMLLHHLDELTQGPAFRGSHRSQQFLRHVVEKALQGACDQLRERIIGIDLFQRPPGYDTGEDAIVRVTATDVRRRLLQHYGRYEDQSQIRILLPSGSYVPEIEFELGAEPTAPAPVPEAAAQAAVPEEVPAERPAKPPKTRHWLLPVLAGPALLALLVSLLWVLRAPRSPTSAISLQPWTAILRNGRTTHLITSDPNIEQLQELTGTDISLSDYANQRYVPSPHALTPEQHQFFSFYLHADNAASVDTPLAVNIARLVPDRFPLDVRSARGLRMRDMRTDDNLILLGSPRSDPWFQMFDSQLDFRFIYSRDANQEIVHNVRPLPGEPNVYVPTARGFATGESFAVVALVQIPNQSGQALLIAGADGEGTEAAGHLVTDRQHLLRALKYCGIAPGGPPQDFELLLRLNTMAGSPSTVDMTACHHLSGYRPV